MATAEVAGLAVQPGGEVTAEVAALAALLEEPGKREERKERVRLREKMIGSGVTFLP